MYEIFEEIFWNVADEMGINEWWVLFDSENFDEVENRICERFGVEGADEVEGFDDWYNEKVMDL